MSQRTSRPGLGRSLLAGLAAGGAAAIVAALVSIPLRSPDDVFLNSATVALGALALGVVAGGVWFLLGGSLLRFLVTLEVIFLAVVLGALAVDVIEQLPLEGAALFVIPLAVIVFALVEIITPLLARARFPIGTLAAPAVVGALVVGIALAGRGDAPSGQLSLPDPPSGASTGSGSASPGSLHSGIVRPQDVRGVAFVVDSSQSMATYTVREKLADLPLPNDAVGRTSAITGTLYLDGRPSKVSVDLRTLASDQPRRDRFIREMGGLPFNRYPFAEFTVTSLDDLPTQYQAGDIVRRNVTGTMKIRDVERPFTFATESRLTDEGLQIKGTGSFTWSEFQIPPPNIRGLVQVEDTVQIEVLLIGKRDGAG